MVKVVRKLLEKINERFWILIVIIVLALNYIWFSRGLIQAGGEEGLPFYNPTRTYELIKYPWFRSDAGIPIIAFLSGIPFFKVVSILFEMGVSNIFLQAVTFSLLMLSGSMALYFSAIYLFKFDKNIALVSSIFYLLNPYSMTQVWGRGIYFHIFAFALIPVFFLFSVLYLEKKKIVYLLLALLGNFIFSVAYMHITYIPVAWFLPFSYLIYFIYKNRHDKKTVKGGIFNFLILFILWVFANLWWLYPSIKQSFEVYSVALNQSEHHLATLIGVSRDFSFFHLIRLINVMNFFRDKIYGDSYLTLIFQLISFIPPIAVFLGIKKLRGNRNYIFLLAIFIFSFIFCSGSNPPFGFIFKWFFKMLTPLQAFRNPFEKFGIILSIPYSLLFGVGILHLSKVFLSYIKKNLKFMWINKNIIIFIFLLLISGIYVWPMWTGIFAGGKKINSWVEVPDYYKKANEWLNKQEGDFRIIQLPLTSGDGMRYEWPHPFQGRESAEFLFSRESISQNMVFNKVYYNVLLSRFGVLQKNAFGPDPDISQSEFRSGNLSEELEKLNVRYIILHKDTNSKIAISRTYEEDKEYLKTQDNISYVMSEGELDIYEVKYDRSVKTIYSPQVDTSYVTISPVYYTVEVKDATEPFQLYLLNNFHPGWEAYVNNELIADHSRVFSYANKWNISKKGNYEVDIIYEPQKNIEFGLKMSIYFTIAGFIVVLFSIWGKRRKIY